MVLHKKTTLQFVSGKSDTVGKYDGGLIHWPVLPHIEYPSKTSYGPHQTYRQLIGGHKLKHVTIRGGTIDGGGKFWCD
eukprot:6878143-Pyramimonas_sp.AAC.1